MIRYWWYRLMAKMFDSYRSRLEPKLPSYLPLEEFKKSGFDLDKMRLLGKKLAISDAEYVFYKVKSISGLGLAPFQRIAMKNMLLEFDLMEEGYIDRELRDDIFDDLLNRRKEAFEQQKQMLKEYRELLPDIKRMTDGNGVETRVQ